MRRKKRQRVSDEEFVRAWQEAETLSEAAEHAGQMPRDASLRAHHMRKRGVPLKLFGNSTAPLDVEKLARVAKEANRG